MKNVVFLFTLIFTLGATSPAKTLRVAAYDLDPYVSSDRSEQGYLYEMVERAFAIKGYKLEVTFYPSARAKKIVESGEADVLIPAYASSKDSDTLIFSQPMPGSEVGYIHLVSEKTPNNKERLQLREEYERAVIEGGAIGDKGSEKTVISTESNNPTSLFGEDDGVIRSSSNRVLRVIDMLASKRVKLAIADKYQVTDILANNRPNLIGKLKFIVPALATKDFHVAVSSRNPDALAIVNDFNLGLQKLRSTGEYEAILVRYGRQIRKADANTLSIGTIANADMKILRELSSRYVAAHPGVNIRWYMLEENLLRRALLANLALGENSFDVITLGIYDNPIYAANGWLSPINPPKSYDVDDLLKPIRQGLTYQNQLYGLPFYGESMLTFYRKDLFDKAGLKMPQQPTYADLEAFAARLHDPKNGVSGFCLRGRAGWGQNSSLVTKIAHDFGASWLTHNGEPNLLTPAWKSALALYHRLGTNYGPPNVQNLGYLENLSLFAEGHCAIWTDATVSAGYLQNPQVSKVANVTGITAAPVLKDQNGTGWLWAWAFAIPNGTQKKALALDFITWATSKEYVQLVGKEKGWLVAPPGTRASTYNDPHYRATAPFADQVRQAIETRDKDPLLVRETRQFVPIPEFTALGNTLGIYTSQLLTNQLSVEEVQKQAQVEAQKIMKRSDLHNKPMSSR